MERKSEAVKDVGTNQDNSFIYMISEKQVKLFDVKTFQLVYENRFPTHVKLFSMYKLSNIFFLVDLKNEKKLKALRENNKHFQPLQELEYEEENQIFQFRILSEKIFLLSGKKENILVDGKVIQDTYKKISITILNIDNYSLLFRQQVLYFQNFQLQVPSQNANIFGYNQKDSGEITVVSVKDMK